MVAVITGDRVKFSQKWLAMTHGKPRLPHPDWRGTIRGFRYDTARSIDMIRVKWDHIDRTPTYHPDFLEAAD
jgi:hypothetical protein